MFRLQLHVLTNLKNVLPVYGNCTNITNAVPTKSRSNKIGTGEKVGAVLIIIFFLTIYGKWCIIFYIVDDNMYGIIFELINLDDKACVFLS
jgi:hypothetical protein